MTTRLRGVLFDVDGTLVDSTYIHALCWWQAFRRTDRDVTMARIHRAIGMGADNLIPHLLDNVSTEEIDQLADAHSALYSAYWSRLRPLRGARALLERCRAEGLTTVVASSAADRELRVLLDALDADAFIDVTTSSDDAEASKPAPDIVQSALSKSGLDPSVVVFIGDSVWDVAASAKVAVPCVGLECGGTGRAELIAAGAIEAYEDPADLLAHFTDTALAT
jgi:HAD superfamily hydrolase (TIGR01509 family)